MSQNWPTFSLGELTSQRPISYGVLKPGPRQKNGVPLIRITDIKENFLDESELYLITDDLSQKFKRSILQGGEVLLSIQGTIGRVAICPQHLSGANISRTIALIAPDERVNRDFLRYWLLSAQDVFPVGGATRDSLNIGDIRNLRCPVPPLAEQQQIVRLLDEVFEGIAIAKANLEKNLLNARALFRGYLHSAFFEDNDHWQSKNFEDCIQLVQYTRKVQRQKFLSEGRFPIISQEADFSNGFWNDEADLFEVVRPVVIFGDHTRVLKYVDSSFVLGADGVRILSPHEFLNPKFFYYQLLGTDIGSLGYSRHYRLLKEIKIGFPSLEEQARVVSRLDDIARQSQRLADLYVQKLAALELLRESILGQLLMDRSKAA